MVEARCDSVVDVVKGSCGGVFGFEAVLCMMLLCCYDVVGELSQEFLRSQRAAKLAEKMCQCYDLCQALV